MHLCEPIEGTIGGPGDRRGTIHQIQHKQSSMDNDQQSLNVSNLISNNMDRDDHQQHPELNKSCETRDWVKNNHRRGRGLSQLVATGAKSIRSIRVPSRRTTNEPLLDSSDEKNMNSFQEQDEDNDAILATNTGPKDDPDDYSAESSEKSIGSNNMEHKTKNVGPEKKIETDVSSLRPTRPGPTKLPTKLKVNDYRCRDS